MKGKGKEGKKGFGEREREGGGREERACRGGGMCMIVYCCKKNCCIMLNYKWMVHSLRSSSIKLRNSARNNNNVVPYKVLSGHCGGL